MKFQAHQLQRLLGEAGLKNPTLAYRGLDSSASVRFFSPSPRNEIDFDNWSSALRQLDKAPSPGDACLVLELSQCEQMATEAFRGYGAIAVLVRSNVTTEDGKTLRTTARILFDLGYVPIRPLVFPDASIVQAYGRSSAALQKSHLGAFGQARVSMTSLGSNGRFANQLLQYAFLKLYALRHSLDLQIPAWEGQEVFDLHDNALLGERMPELRYFAFDDDDRFLWTIDDPPVGVDFWGYFQEMPACWSPHRQLLRNLFTPRPELEQSTRRAIGALRGLRHRPVIAIHVRRGDYTTLSAEVPWYRLVPLEWYVEWIRNQLSERPNAIVYVASDDLDAVLPAFAQFNPKTFRDTDLPSTFASIFDFQLLRNAQSLAVVNSSFSRMAAILAEEGQHSSIVDFEKAKFLPYEPWIDPNFWARFAVPGKGDPSFGSSLEAVQRRSLHHRLELGRYKSTTPSGRLPGGA